jgi:hypothetical protein
MIPILVSQTQISLDGSINGFENLMIQLPIDLIPVCYYWVRILYLQLLMLDSCLFLIFTLKKYATR